jgi:hypothetical protein
MSDVIFWYTGAIAWGFIGMACAVAVIIAIIGGCAHAYHRAGWWFLMVWVGRADIDQVQAAINAAAKSGVISGQPSAEWLAEFQKHMKRHGAKG